MSDVTEQRMCDEHFMGSDEAGEEVDVESYLEDNSSELLDRLRELEAENSALLLANESQREAYERCLDEVANHVVQALLNQKDLREECIKLKMLVFDLERQNRALCELFQQKLPNHPTAHYQFQAGPLPDYNAQPHNDSTKQVEAAQTEAQAKGNGYRTQHTSPGPRGPAASMEALSPFFKKKAHILEVLRKMEETDPLKFHPSTTSLSFCDYSQCEAGGVAKPTQDGPPEPCVRVCSPLPSVPAHSHRGPPATTECHNAKSTATVVLESAAPPSKHSNKNDKHQQAAHTPLTQAANQSQDVTLAEPNKAQSCPTGSSAEGLSGFYPSISSSYQPIPEKDGPPPSLQLPKEPIIELPGSLHNGLLGVPEPSGSDVPERDTADRGPAPQCTRLNAPLVGPCLGEAKAVAAATTAGSPSKLLKFLKIPSAGEKAAASVSPVRLSPQLTRSSRIPCRTNNYEVYHSPVPPRRAATAERCRQPPPPPSRSESYPATHSAPTSPPQQPLEEAASSPPAKEEPSAPPKAPAQIGVPHYENVDDVAARRGERPGGPLPEKRTTLPSHAKVGGVGHSLPSSSVPGKAPARPHYSRERDKREAEARESTAAQQVPERSGGSGPGRSPADSGHHAFKDRLAALGKLRSSEDLRVRPSEAPSASVEREGPASKTAERPAEQPHKEEQKHAKYSDTPDGKAKAPGGGLKYPGASQTYEVPVKPQGAGTAAVKPELCIPKTDSPKSKIGLPSPSTDAPQALRNNMRCPGSLNLGYNKAAFGPPSSNSPNKIPPKSPSKPSQGPSHHPRGAKPAEQPRYSSKSEERSKIAGKGKKTYGDSLPPPPPRPPASEPQEEKATPPPVPSPQSAIEQKVMKGIEENMLKLQEQDRVTPGAVEVKQKSSNGIASWFGLKKSKLPALSRKADGAKAKEEKREWKINIPSVGKDSQAKVASRCKEGVEGLNISTLMEKAEGLRRALEEERAYVERSGRGHSCEVVMDQSQGQLAVMYRGARSDNFMQQLLNRVDGKDVISVPQRRLSFDCKTSRPVFTQQGDVISHMGSAGISNVTSDENLADSVHSQHFAASGASTYTLDSGIGTFPLPDGSSGGGAAGRSLSKMRAGGGAGEHRASGSPGRVGRRARTLDREMTSQEECYSAPHRQLVPTVQYGSMLEGRGPAGVILEDKETHGPNMFSARSKTWTFPNLKTPAGSAEVYLAVEEEEEEPVSFSSFRASVKDGVPSSSSRGVVDPGSLPVPVQSGLGRRGKTRTPSIPEMGREAGLELLRERPEEAISPSRPQVLETPESLSDSLYDSLSSCGSQG
ncbi:hypothetical protein NHX12_012281 [Muraenolepis orangiensis]|uniref:Nck-associated protein 5 C-terminal domain-containing protein n=1 Tax=Muraenolepis orangiensis TaxID=630683 RepID=A0A9Q0DE18_9TELE|nr:hypothetical protein NHX12_012281 [Muraenolepis orangiensis]